MLVFSRFLTDVTPSSVDMAKVLSSGVKSTSISSSKLAGKVVPAGDDPFVLPDLYKEKIFKQARELGYNDDSAGSNDDGAARENMVSDLLEDESEKSIPKDEEEIDE